MDGNSSTVISSQDGVHRRLADALLRHFGRPWCAAALARGRPLLLDSGCGDGAGTEALARVHPECVAVGVDRSAARLAGRLDGARGDVLFVRTDVPRLWQALRMRGVRVAHHYLLYPNPAPKPAQRLRRWHFHPAFPDLLALGGTLEVRTNWRIYAEEFAAALALAGRDPALEPVPDGDALTAFERKYRASGHVLWRVRAAA
jgi:tRNA (guanine-N7-)-methyltransferase